MSIEAGSEQPIEQSGAKKFSHEAIEARGAERVRELFTTLERNSDQLGDPRLTAALTSLKENPHGEVDFSGMPRSDVELVMLTAHLGEVVRNIEGGVAGSRKVRVLNTDDDGNPIQRDAFRLGDQAAADKLAVLLGVDRDTRYVGAFRPRDYGTSFPWVDWRERTKGEIGMFDELAELRGKTRGAGKGKIITLDVQNLSDRAIAHKRERISPQATTSKT